MAIRFTSDLKHFLDDKGGIPSDIHPEGREMALFLTKIIEAVTIHPMASKNSLLTDRLCPADQCNERVFGFYADFNQPIAWKCKSCGAEGTIQNWQFSKWDLAVSEEPETDDSLLTQSPDDTFFPHLPGSGFLNLKQPRLKKRKKTVSKKRDHILQVKITLDHVKPSIWRRIEIPCTYTFWDLHVAVQDAMGWEDMHLHQFEVTDPISGERLFLGIPDDDEMYPESTIPGWQVPVVTFLTLAHRTLKYEYDFGDSWEHTITLEKIKPFDNNVNYPCCTGGRRACPPEDSGGAHIYEELLKLLKSTNDADREEAMNNLEIEVGTKFNPERFDINKVQFTDPKQRFLTYFDDFE